MSYLGTSVGKMQICTLILGGTAVGLTVNNYYWFMSQEVYFFIMSIVTGTLSAFLAGAAMCNAIKSWDCLSIMFNICMGAGMGLGCAMFLICIITLENWRGIRIAYNSSGWSYHNSFLAMRCSALALETINTFLYFIIALKSYKTKSEGKTNPVGGVVFSPYPTQPAQHQITTVNPAQQMGGQYQYGNAGYSAMPGGSVPGGYGNNPGYNNANAMGSNPPLGVHQQGMGGFQPGQPLNPSGSYSTGNGFTGFMGQGPPTTNNHLSPYPSAPQQSSLLSPISPKISIHSPPYPKY